MFLFYKNEPKKRNGFNQSQRKDPPPTAVPSPATYLRHRIVGLRLNILKDTPQLIHSLAIQIHYIYSADGTKLRKKIYDSGGNWAQTVDYVGPFQFDDADGNGTASDPELSFFSHEKGRTVFDGTLFMNQYQLTDHLGNVRVLFSDTDGDGKINPDPVAGNDVLQTTDYYPFGARMAGGTNVVASPPNQYLYNGKELQEEMDLNWYDYGARMYDPVVGRWNGVDALAEDFHSWSPYNYAFNNPIRFVDPTGNAPGDVLKMLNGYSSSLNQKMNSSYDKSFYLTPSGGSRVRENGFIIVNRTVSKLNRETKQMESQTISYDKNHVVSTSEDGGDINYDFSLSEGETLAGTFHTHPYAGGQEGITFSGEDIVNNIAHGIEDGVAENFTALVESGSKRFALVVLDKEKAAEFLNNNDNLLETYNNVINEAEGDLASRAMKAAKLTIGNASESGIGFFETTDKEKQNFQQINQ